MPENLLFQPSLHMIKLTASASKSEMKTYSLHTHKMRFSLFDTSVQSDIHSITDSYLLCPLLQTILHQVFPLADILYPFPVSPPNLVGFKQSPSRRPTLLKHCIF